MTRNWKISGHFFRAGWPVVEFYEQPSGLGRYEVNRNLEVSASNGRTIRKLHPIEYLENINNYKEWIPHYLKTGELLFLKAGDNLYFIKDSRLINRKV